MTDRILYWATVVSACLALVLFAANVAVMKGNQSIRDNINHKQMVINTASKVMPLNQQLSQALYEASADKSNKKDAAKIRALLTDQGFVLPSKEAVAAAKKAKKSKKKK